MRAVFCCVTVVGTSMMRHCCLVMSASVAHVMTGVANVHPMVDMDIMTGMASVSQVEVVIVSYVQARETLH